jgi:short-chain Z-isoprenyl diphosphate synthase
MVSGALPRHLGIIPDGNRRWAELHGLPHRTGHQLGVAKVPEVVAWCSQAGIQVVTIYMLSMENLERNPSEGLESLSAEAVSLLAELPEIKLHPIGAIDRLPASTQAIVRRAAEATSGGRGTLVNLGLAYNGREDIVDAVQAILANSQAQNRPPHPITKDLISDFLSTAGQPDPDFIIRTSGELRASGFLTWQAEQAEWYFLERYWPDFTQGDLALALESFAKRKRRYGR